jgi:hypothetical protein
MAAWGQCETPWKGFPLALRSASQLLKSAASDWSSDHTNSTGPITTVSPSITPLSRSALFTPATPPKIADEPDTYMDN